jgi:cytochrome c oxidase subunit 3
MQVTQKSSAMQLGWLVLGAIAVLMAVEFTIAVTIHAWIVLLIIPIIKAVLVFYYYMHINLLFQEEKDPNRESVAYKIATNRLGLWFFLVSDTFIFGGLMISRINLLGLTRPNVVPVLGLVVTSILLLSSFFANRAQVSMEFGDHKQFITNLVLTIGLGVLFLLGVVGVEWRTAPFTPATNLSGAIYFAMTGFHAFHVFSGVIFLGIVLRNGLHRVYTPEKHWAVEASVIYWEFIDVVWFFFYPALYLIGTIATN